MFFNDIGGGKRGRQFLHIDDLESLTAAAILGGSGSAALKCWLAATHRARMTGGGEIKLTTSLCRQFGILTRKAKESALRHWELLGVFKVQRQNGKNPRVTIIGKLGACRRRAKLTRNQVVGLGGEFGNIATFNESEDYTARTTNEADRKQLEQVSLRGDFADLDLVDYGSGWLVESISTPSLNWKKAQSEEYDAATTATSARPHTRRVMQTGVSWPPDPLNP
jgi:hypothetical protein